MQTIPVEAIPVGAYVRHVETAYERQDTDDYGPVVSVYRPYQSPGLVRIMFKCGKTVQSVPGMVATVYGL